MKKSIQFLVAGMLCSCLALAQTNIFPASGNVGIGTATPAYKLHVAGEIYSSSRILAGGYGMGPASLNAFSIELGGNPTATNGEGVLMLHHHNAIAHQLRYTNGILFLEACGFPNYATSTTPTLQVNGSVFAGMQGGGVGIGTTNLSTHKLSVNGSILSTGKIFGANYPYTEGSVNAFSYELGGTNPTATNGQATMFLHHHGVVAHQLRYANGTLYLEKSGTWYASNNTPNFQVSGSLFACTSGGGVGIGTTNLSGYQLAVNGKIRAKEIVVESNWADYVFDDTYQLRSPEELKAYIHMHRHLPDMPAAGEVQTEGVKLGETQTLLLKKVEELTLYMLQQHDEIEQLKKQNKELEKAVLTAQQH